MPYNLHSTKIISQCQSSDSVIKMITKFTSYLKENTLFPLQRFTEQIHYMGNIHVNVKAHGIYSNCCGLEL